MVSTSASFSNSIIDKTATHALSTTTWQCDIDLNLDTTYYWKVRAVTSDSYSGWSAVSSLTTRSTSVIVPNIYSPEAGGREVELKPVFQWSAIAGAESYELLVSTDISFANPVIVKVGDYALPTTAWQCDINLNPDTTYYWKVRAVTSDSYNGWSAVSAFITESSAVQQATPSWVRWLIYIGGALLLTLLAILTIMIMLTVKVFRL